jgi:hypothetical protein
VKQQTDWELPTISQLLSIRECSKGVSLDGTSNIPDDLGGTFKISHICTNDSASPTLNTKVFPNTPTNDWYFSSSPVAGSNGGNNWVVSFSSGHSYQFKRGDNYLRLVRSSQSLGHDVFMNIFNAEVARQKEITAAIEAKAIKAKQEEDLRQHERDKEAERQAKIRAEIEAKELQARLKKEAALTVQPMYLQAGKYDRNSQLSDAVRLYELLIEKYPNHPLAVQANNRLVGIKSGNDAASAASNRASAERSRASADCKKRKDAYLNSCSSIGDWDSRHSCYSRADSICSE